MTTLLYDTPTARWAASVERAADAGKALWRYDEFRTLGGQCDMSGARVDQLLRKMCAAGKIERILSGRYAIAGRQLDPAEVVRFIDPGAVTTGRYVLYVNNATEDAVCARVDAITLGKPRRVTAGNVDYVFHRVPMKFMCGFSMEDRKAYPEKALLDAVYLSSMAAKRSKSATRAPCFDVTDIMLEGVGLRRPAAGCEAWLPRIAEYIELYPPFVSRKLDAAGLKWRRPLKTGKR